LAELNVREDRQYVPILRAYQLELDGGALFIPMPSPHDSGITVVSFPPDNVKCFMLNILDVRITQEIQRATSVSVTLPYWVAYINESAKGTPRARAELNALTPKEYVTDDNVSLVIPSAFRMSYLYRLDIVPVDLLDLSQWENDLDDTTLFDTIENITEKETYWLYLVDSNINRDDNTITLNFTDVTRRFSESMNIGYPEQAFFQVLKNSYDAGETWIASDQVISAISQYDQLPNVWDGWNFGAVILALLYYVGLTPYVSESDLQQYIQITRTYDSASEMYDYIWKNTNTGETITLARISKHLAEHTLPVSDRYPNKDDTLGDGYYFTSDKYNSIRQLVDDLSSVYGFTYWFDPATNKMFIYTKDAQLTYYDTVRYSSDGTDTAISSLTSVNFDMVFDDTNVRNDITVLGQKDFTGKPVAYRVVDDNSKAFFGHKPMVYSNSLILTKNQCQDVAQSLLERYRYNSSRVSVDGGYPFQAILPARVSVVLDGVNLGKDITIGDVTNKYMEIERIEKQISYPYQASGTLQLRYPLTFIEVTLPTTYIQDFWVEHDAYTSRQITWYLDGTSVGSTSTPSITSTEFEQPLNLTFEIKAYFDNDKWIDPKGTGQAINDPIPGFKPVDITFVAVPMFRISQYKSVAGKNFTESGLSPECANRWKAHIDVNYAKNQIENTYMRNDEWPIQSKFIQVFLARPEVQPQEGTFGTSQDTGFGSVQYVISEHETTLRVSLNDMVYADGVSMKIWDKVVIFALWFAKAGENEYKPIVLGYLTIKYDWASYVSEISDNVFKLWSGKSDGTITYPSVGDVVYKNIGLRPYYTFCFNEMESKIGDKGFYIDSTQNLNSLFESFYYTSRVSGKLYITQFVRDKGQKGILFWTCDAYLFSNQSIEKFTVTKLNLSATITATQLKEPRINDILDTSQKQYADIFLAFSPYYAFDPDDVSDYFSDYFRKLIEPYAYLFGKGVYYVARYWVGLSTNQKIYWTVLKYTTLDAGYTGTSSYTIVDEVFKNESFGHPFGILRAKKADTAVPTGIPLVFCIRSNASDSYKDSKIGFWWYSYDKAIAHARYNPYSTEPDGTDDYCIQAPHFYVYVKTW